MDYFVDFKSIQGQQLLYYWSQSDKTWCEWAIIVKHIYFKFQEILISG